MEARLQYRRGLLGEVQISLEVAGKPISLGSIHSREDQESVVRFIDLMNGLLCDDRGETGGANRPN